MRESMAVGTAPSRFDAYLAASPQGGSVDDWTVPRCTAYIYLSPTQSLTSDPQAAAYNAAGFEIGVHLDTGCADYTAQSLDTFFADQMGQFIAKYPSLPAQTTHRIHCIAWSDYSTPACVSRAHGIRLETSYYYWPPEWVTDRPGLFTGSGMPMRFATTNGAILDIYQATTQMTDRIGAELSLHGGYVVGPGTGCRGILWSVCGEYAHRYLP